MRIGLVMGVLGGYTTFSTYAQESLDLLREGQAGASPRSTPPEAF